jgi:hypothetical protein
VVMITGARTTRPGVEVLRKPFDLSVLVATVARHCEHAGSDDGRSPTDQGPEKAGSPPT